MKYFGYEKEFEGARYKEYFGNWQECRGSFIYVFLQFMHAS